MLKTTDNNCGKYQVDEQHIPNLKKIADVQVRNLQLEENKQLLVFPHSLNAHGDSIGEKSIFSLQESTLTTENMMGFVGVNDTELTIQSRFAKDKEDYFLHFMLQKVFAINMFDLKHSFSSETIFDFLHYLLPFYLKKALKQGLFKEYRHRKHNNTNVRGAIDINRHISKNLPFAGNIAYNTRDFSYDNRITQLIRHTIEHVKQFQYGHTILNNDSETKSCVNQVIMATPNYNRRDRIDIIIDNAKPFVHPYYQEYRPLQQICLRILRYEGLKYGTEKDKVYGLLFDGAWLWEEYLHTLLHPLEFIHPQNKKGKNPIYLFKETKESKRYPDFYKDEVVLDAKYRRPNNIGREDEHQLITYMYLLKATIGGFICPSDSLTQAAVAADKGILNGYGGAVKIWMLPIPQSTNKYQVFCEEMNKIERLFIDDIKLHSIL
ncbi:McrC family protein [Chitinophaga sp. Hz27]|uniref:McrC family protein n=1 Tax=Chitinophaga sp. Hz27 TaxID=3347169 RepID=UPI0035E17C48